MPRYPHTGVKAIDDEIVAWVNAEVAALKEQGPPDPEWATGAYSLDIDYEVARNDAAVFGVRFNEMTLDRRRASQPRRAHVQLPHWKSKNPVWLRP